MRTDAFHTVCQRLLVLSGGRVWSLIVTVFGDLAAEDGARISGPVLSDLMARMDIRPEATRVALHRLRKDGWITSVKQGRQSLHGLTGHGLSETKNAGLRIYALSGARSEPWVVLMTDPSRPDPVTALKHAGYMPLGNRQYIGPSSLNVPQDTLRLEGSSAPRWLLEKLGGPLLKQEYDVLFAELTEAENVLRDAASLCPEEQAVLRCLIVHNWRRLLLKHPDIPQPLHPPGWRGEACRDLVHSLLARFPRPDLMQQ